MKRSRIRKNHCSGKKIEDASFGSAERNVVEFAITVSETEVSKFLKRKASTHEKRNLVIGDLTLVRKGNFPLKSEQKRIGTFRKFEPVPKPTTSIVPGT